MKKDIVLAGVGGQGILSIAASIGLAAIEAGLHIKQSEVHGMSQRGGDVQANLRLSDKEIASDLIPGGKADLIISIEPMESLRYLPFLSQGGWLVTNTQPYDNIKDYPDINLILEEIRAVSNHILIDAGKLALETGSKKSANMVILGAAAPFLGLDYTLLEKAVATLFRSKGNEVVEANIKALQKGKDFTGEYLKN
ncbi:MAG: indolepyruvate oxidoreductase subunit beta [Bacteroidales bacterium]|nr:indolepyruvate oxidoreductase subunit beta [Bacteroidales bacterium]